MDIIISNSCGKPIYEQITSQIKEMIMNGTLKEGEPLPSMRNLAQQLRISIITTKRAYEELERDGFIESFTGKGSFVCRQDQDFVREEGLKQIEEYLTLAIDKAKICGVEMNELSELLKMIYEGE
ncbi:MAG: GntR family transcriptional regulator [Clostridia bacterium]|nr:GntR family transcriptional regulator [Clostridia bacterium]